MRNAVAVLLSFAGEDSIVFDLKQLDKLLEQFSGVKLYRYDRKLRKRVEIGSVRRAWHDEKSSVIMGELVIIDDAFFVPFRQLSTMGWRWLDDRPQGPDEL